MRVSTYLVHNGSVDLSSEALEEGCLVAVAVPEPGEMLDVTSEVEAGLMATLELEARDIPFDPELDKDLLQELERRGDLFDRGLMETYPIEQVFAGIDDLMEVASIHRRVSAFFGGDAVKTGSWFQTRNPMLGDVAPCEMVLLGRHKELQQFVTRAFPSLTPKEQADLSVATAEADRGDLVDDTHVRALLTEPLQRGR